MYKFVWFLLVCPCFYLASFDFLAYQHRIENIDFDFNATISLDDSSVWEVDQNSMEEALTFKASDPVIVTLNTLTCFSKQAKYPFALVNQRTNSAINIKTLFHPLIDNPFARFLFNLDKQKQTITLSDQLTFTLNPHDSPIYANWQEKDFILIGINIGWLGKLWFNQYSVLLINLSTNTYVQANPA